MTQVPLVEGPRRRKLWPFINFVPRQTHFNFVGLAPYAAVLSVLLVIVSGASIAMQQVNFGRLEKLVIADRHPVFNPPPRTIREIKFGLRIHLIVRETDEEAWAVADKLIAVALANWGTFGGALCFAVAGVMQFYEVPGGG